MQERGERVYRAALYIRLSKEDGDKQESNSVGNQRQLIYTYLKGRPEIQACAEHVDDGYSGVTFQRPGITRLLQQVREGEINCVIVKDLSRFGRNYIETGKYLQQIFPFLGIRFIAINDNYDSASQDRREDSILLPFKNLMNDFYSRDISVKVRSQMEARKKQGEYVGSFPVFGYAKDSGQKGRLVVDGKAAAVVREIFAMKLEGRSHERIAQILNAHGVLPPAEYKASQGLSYATPFRWKPEAKWSGVAVERILKNETYTGAMVQGKERTVSYKVKKRIQVPKEDWIRVEGTHEPIVSKEEFGLVQKLLFCDTRTPPQAERVCLFAGLLYCGDCGAAMVRKKVRAAGKDYDYYICSENKRDKRRCSSHRLREDYLKEAVLKTLQAHMLLAHSWERLRAGGRGALSWEHEVHRKEERLREQRAEILRCQSLKQALYEDYKEGLLGREEYREMKEHYGLACVEKERAAKLLEKELQAFAQGGRSCSQELEDFTKAGTVAGLTRRLLIFVVDKIVVLEDGRIRIYFRYRKEGI